MTTKSSWKTTRAISIAVLSGLGLATAAGCQTMAAFFAAMAGGDTIKPEFTLTKGPILVFIDDRESKIDQPVAIRECHETIADNFARFNVNTRLIPLSEWQQLEQTDEKYEKMSIRQVGEKLGAEQVVYVRVDQFTLQSEPGAPLYKGLFTGRVKVLSTEREPNVRLWPREESGRLVKVETQPVSTGGEKSANDVARELGQRMGKQVAGLFYEHREFDE